ncbi:hypothetical protein EVAR_49863_1 [Eumeta japonica]|uniref:Uncharacterized protein n=1 Tax=Eumeta variegata TaxID=151549 RepID=A0A4C1XYZ5_EUMVA|nr:hypothetical protein EVAR_49863_1 [Eumeta japonica]
MADKDITSYLKLWGLEHLCAHFKEHKITLAVALMLTENDIDRLIPFIGDCAVFKANWKYLKVTNTNEQLEFDFASAYPEYTNSLFNNFPLIKIKIISLVKARKKDSFLCYLETLFENSEEISNIATFLALAHLHGTATIPYRLPGIRKTKIWRPSKQEIREGFIAHVTSATEVKNVMQE